LGGHNDSYFNEAEAVATKTSGMNRKDTVSGQTGNNAERKKRLAEELRANLRKRKAQARSRRTGDADSRPEGIEIASEQPKMEL
jgi:predicted aminopeptidase